MVRQPPSIQAEATSNISQVEGISKLGADNASVPGEPA